MTYGGQIPPGPPYGGQPQMPYQGNYGYAQQQQRQPQPQPQQPQFPQYSNPPAYMPSQYQPIHQYGQQQRQQQQPMNQMQQPQRQYQQSQPQPQPQSQSAYSMNNQYAAQFNGSYSTANPNSYSTAPIPQYSYPSQSYSQPQMPQLPQLQQQQQQQQRQPQFQYQQQMQRRPSSGQQHQAHHQLQQQPQQVRYSPQPQRPHQQQPQILQPAAQIHQQHPPQHQRASPALQYQHAEKPMAPALNNLISSPSMSPVMSPATMSPPPSQVPIMNRTASQTMSYSPVSASAPAPALVPTPTQVQALPPFIKREPSPAPAPTVAPAAVMPSPSIPPPIRTQPDISTQFSQPASVSTPTIGHPPPLVASPPVVASSPAPVPPTAAAPSPQMPPPSTTPLAQSPQVQSQTLPQTINPNLLQRSTPTQSFKFDPSRRLSEIPSPRMESSKVAKPDPRRASSVTSGVARSPSLTPSLHHQPVDNVALLICIAEDCFSKADASIETVAATMDSQLVDNYYKLIATGLGCLEAALQGNKLQPRLEARIRLRYSSILSEETENITEAESVLVKGVSLCDKHRLSDLKYYMQFMLCRALFLRTPKAAYISLDSHISDAEAYKHPYWVYAFRLQKALFYFQAGTLTEANVIEDIKGIKNLADSRGDKAMSILAPILEALVHLRAKKDDYLLKVKTAVAEGAKFQCDESARIPQLDILLMLLNLSCTLHEKNTEDLSRQVNLLSNRLDNLLNSPDWNGNKSELLIPIQKQAGQPISEETGAILRPGKGKHDYIVLSFLSKLEAFVVGYVLNGLASMYKPHSSGRDRRVLDFWAEAMRLLKSYNRNLRSHQTSLHKAVEEAKWVTEVRCYIHVLTGLHSATNSHWDKVKQDLSAIQSLSGRKPFPGMLGSLCSYLKGAYYQGVGDLTRALEIYCSPAFELDRYLHAVRSDKHGEFELAVLATLNRLWIIQHPDYEDEKTSQELMETLSATVTDSVDIELRTAYHLVMATAKTHPRQPISQVKSHIHHSLTSSQKTHNTHCLSLALNIMRCKLFENVVGEQALKSAKAASAQAVKSGNKLWKSVADGMLADSYEVQGAKEEATRHLESAASCADEVRGLMQKLNKGL